MARTGRPRRIDFNKVIELYEKLGSVKLVAQELGCSQCYVSKVKKKAGLKKVTGTRNQYARGYANQILDELIQNGGTLKAVTERMKLKVCDAVIYQVAQERGIVTRDYRHLHKSNGHWTVTRPGGFHRTKESGEYEIPATCMNCGTETPLLHRQLYKEAAPTCPHCGTS